MTVVPTDSLPTEIAVLAKQTIIESGLKVVPTDSLPMEITDGETVTQSNLDIAPPDSSQREGVRISDAQLLSTIGDFSPDPIQPFGQIRIQEFSRPSSYNNDIKLSHFTPSTRRGPGGNGRASISASRMPLPIRISPIRR